MDRGRVGEDRGSKETDGCPLTAWVFIVLFLCLFSYNLYLFVLCPCEYIEEVVDFLSCYIREEQQGER
jgi:hypothetical protein